MNLHVITLWLLIIGGLNWLLVGLLDMNLVALLFGDSILATVVYVLVGLSAIYQILVALKLVGHRTGVATA